MRMRLPTKLRWKRISCKIYCHCSTINIVSIGKSLQIAKAVRAAGFGATRSSGEGESGTVGLVRVVTLRRNTTQIVKLVTQADPKAFLTVEETRAVAHGFLERVSGRS